MGPDRSNEPTQGGASSGEPADAGFEVSSGTLLVASPELIEPTFSRTVVYLIEHNESGSLGVILNRMSQTAVHNLLPQWTDIAASPRALYVGGPVNQEAALCLGVVKPGTDIDDVPALRPVDGRVVLVDLDAGEA